LRSPIIMGQAVVVRTKGINQSFFNDELTFSKKDITTLDLKGGGLRAMAYIPDLAGYLFISGKGEEQLMIIEVKGKRVAISCGSGMGKKQPGKSFVFLKLPISRVMKYNLKGSAPSLFGME
jgi:hypothetical protein